MVPLLRLTNDPGGPTALSRMLASSAEVAKPPFGVLLAEWSADRLLYKTRFLRTLFTVRLAWLACFLCHGHSPTWFNEKYVNKSLT